MRGGMDNAEDTDALIIAYLIGDIDKDGLAKLEALLACDSKARDRFARLCEQDLALHQALASVAQARSETNPLTAPITAGFSAFRRSSSGLKILLAAALILLGVTVFIFSHTAPVARISQA